MAYPGREIQEAQVFFVNRQKKLKRKRLYHCLFCTNFFFKIRFADTHKLNVRQKFEANKIDLDLNSQLETVA